jgi:hypothetical protein
MAGAVETRLPLPPIRWRCARREYRNLSRPMRPWKSILAGVIVTIFWIAIIAGLYSITPDNEFFIFYVLFYVLGGHVLGGKVRRGAHSGEMSAGEMSAYPRSDLSRTLPSSSFFACAVSASEWTVRSCKYAICEINVYILFHSILFE